MCVCVQYLGKSGLVSRVDLDEVHVMVVYFVAGSKFRLVSDALKKVVHFGIFSSVYAVTPISNRWMAQI